MEIKILYIYTEDLSFFYKLNKELNRLKIKFKILNVGHKIPNIPCLIITTTEEIKKIRNPNPKKVTILSYDKEFSFQAFILKILAAYRIGYKIYKELTFSIDPGEKHLGLAIFLDDYYLNSHTIYEKKDLIKKIKNYVDFLQGDKSNLMKLNFKFGIGVLPITEELVKLVYNRFKNRQNMSLYLIDETKSSKLRIHSKVKIYNKERKILKDEASALILALRDGIEINQNNYYKIFGQIKAKKFKMERFEYPNDIITKLAEIAEKVLKGELSLNESTEILNEIKSTHYL